jgi:hypothetical protein
MFVPGKLQIIRPAPKSVQAAVLVILNVTEGGVKDLLYLTFDIGAKRRSTKTTDPSNQTRARFAAGSAAVRP